MGVEIGELVDRSLEESLRFVKLLSRTKSASELVHVTKVLPERAGPISDNINNFYLGIVV